MLPGRQKIACEGKNTMDQFTSPEIVTAGEVSTLVLSDRLITLAQAADRAGFTGTAEQLVTLACAVFDEAPKPRH
jgi:hypothetical protein